MPTLINRSINLDQTKRFTDTIFLTQGEGGATTLNFTLMQSGAVIDLTGCTVNFLAKKPSGATLTNACTLTNAALGKAAYVVTTQTATEAGALTDARLEVLKSGVAWKSFKFPVTVEAVPDYTTAIQSTNEFTTLQSLTPQITASATAIGTLASLLTTAKTNLVAAINELFSSKADAPTSGTWTPSIAGATVAGVNTYSLRVGAWYKIGKLVFASFDLTMTVKGGTMAGIAQISGLPFAIDSATKAAPVFGLFSNISLPVARPILVGSMAGTDIALLSAGSDQAASSLVDTAIQATTRIRGSIVYQAA